MTKKKEFSCDFRLAGVSRWLMYDERSSWVVCLPVCSPLYVCVSEEKTLKERNHILDFLLVTRFIILLLFLWQNFILRAGRGDVKASSERFYRRLFLVWVPVVWQRWWIASRRREFILFYLFSTLSGRNKIRVFKISRSLAEFTVELLLFGLLKKIILLPFNCRGFRQRSKYSQ